MHTLMTSLGSWDTIETGHKHRHGITFPLAILGAVIEEAGLPASDVYEGDETPANGCASDYGALLISMMDPRHMWRLAPWLRRVGCPPLAADRSESDPIVIVGGQAASAPAPIEHLVDIVYVGEAEAHAAELLLLVAEAKAAGRPRRTILEAAAAIPGCWVPSCAPAGHVVAKVEAADISISLRRLMSVSLNTNPRLEIARGCKSRCGFCVLGWRSTYRENATEQVLDAAERIQRAGGRQLHLSAGDAEGHSGIARLREGLAERGIRDHGWTGRLDTIRDCSVSAGKQFAVGIEGMSHRLRRAVGKPRLTNGYILEEVAAYWRAGGRRLMFHLIGGLPTENDADAAEFAELMAALSALARGIDADTLHLEIGRQPFGPLPHTPMQWAAPGLSTARIGAVVARYTHDSGGLKVQDKSGQRYQDALINAVVMRGGREVQPLLLAGPPRLSDSEPMARVEWMLWLKGYGLDPYRYLEAWDPDAPTPWDHVLMPPSYGRVEQRRAWARISGMLQYVAV